MVKGGGIQEYIIVHTLASNNLDSNFIKHKFTEIQREVINIYRKRFQQLFY